MRVLSHAFLASAIFDDGSRGNARTVATSRHPVRETDPRLEFDFSICRGRSVVNGDSGDRPLVENGDGRISERFDWNSRGISGTKSKAPPVRSTTAEERSWICGRLPLRKGTPTVDGADAGADLLRLQGMAAAAMAVAHSRHSLI